MTLAPRLRAGARFEKLELLRAILRELDRVLVAYSGGVDSAFLLKVAVDTLGDRVLAVTARSDSYAEGELEDAKRVATEIGAQHLVVDTHEMENEAYLANPSNRCYFCKAELWDTLGPIALGRGITALVDGFNVDDVGDFRPGAKAARERGVRSPLREAGLGKQDIRALSRELGLSTWDKPALACLSSRVPYGESIDREKLSQIDRAERLLRELGFRQVRVRHHGQIARIELPAEDIARFVGEGLAAPVSRRIKELGFQFVTLDLEGYRTGSLNETLKVLPVPAIRPAAELGRQADNHSGESGAPA
jgi:pyridinium-3,5-biscarboxylic acid mononucleotide sulfurtransferase